MRHRIVPGLPDCCKSVTVPSWQSGLVRIPLMAAAATPRCPRLHGQGSCSSPSQESPGLSGASSSPLPWPVARWWPVPSCRALTATAAGRRGQHPQGTLQATPTCYASPRAFTQADLCTPSTPPLIAALCISALSLKPQIPGAGYQEAFFLPSDSSLPALTVFASVKVFHIIPISLPSNQGASSGQSRV